MEHSTSCMKEGLQHLTSLHFQQELFHESDFNIQANNITRSTPVHPLMPLHTHVEPQWFCAVVLVLAGTPNCGKPATSGHSLPGSIIQLFNGWNPIVGLSLWGRWMSVKLIVLMRCPTRMCEHEAAMLTSICLGDPCILRPMRDSTRAGIE